MEDWSGTVYGPTTHGPTPRRKPSPRTPGPGAATSPGQPARPSPRKKTAATSTEPLPEPPATTSAEAPTSTTSAEAAESTSSVDAATSNSPDPGTAVAQSAGGPPSAPAKRSPRKATAPSAESVDEKLLAHLDVVLADVELPPPAPAAPTLPAALTAAPERTALWDQILADPGFAPEHLVRDAVRLLGPQAREWADRTRARYPQAQADALARLAAEMHIRTARRQAMSNTTAVGSWAEVGLLSRTLASLVLTIAAVYGADPTAEARTRDLMELLPIPRLTESSLAAAGNVGRLLGAVAVRRVAARLMPFGAAVAGAIHSGRMTEDVAMRAIDRFRPKASRRP